MARPMHWLSLQVPVNPDKFTEQDWRTLSMAVLRIINRHRTNNVR